MEKPGSGGPLGASPAEGRGRIGGYRLLARLGSGGMGHVYLARSDRGRTVAVKLVREELAAHEDFRARFRQEVRAAQRVGGYWTAPVLDADTEAAVPWVATGYVAGPSLQQVVGHDHGALPERSVRILAAGLAHALTDIHAAGIVHRDLKPSNVLVTIDGPRVIDFGIARALEGTTAGGEGLTRAGSLVGSPGFMAPEQVRGNRITPACDVFCLGSVLVYAATGALPFGDADSGVHALMFRIAEEEPDLEGVPEGIADLVRDCLRKDPAARPSPASVLERTGAEDTVTGGRSRDPWLPGSLVAQLGRHAVGLLEVEDPESEAAASPGAGVRPSASGAGGPGEADAPSAGAGGGGADDVPGAGPGASARSGGGGGAGTGVVTGSPEHAAVSDGNAGAVGAGGQGPAGAGAAGGYQPTVVSGHAPPPGTPGVAAGFGAAPGAYGYPHPQPPAAYGYPPPGRHSYGGNPYASGGLGSTPPYGPAPAGVPPEPVRRSGRSTALLVVVALVVALGAGGSVYALLNRGGAHDKGAGTVGPAPTAGSTPLGTSAAPAPSPSALSSSPSSPSSSSAADNANGMVPKAFRGTWETTIDNANGTNTRALTIRQGGVGDDVLTLVADGPIGGGGTYHCVFEASLTQDPGADGPLEIGPSTVISGEPASSCSPGDPTEVTLLPDGRLKRAQRGGGESLTYRRR